MIREKITVNYKNGAVESYSNVDKLKYNAALASIEFSYVEGDKAIEAKIALNELANRTLHKLNESSSSFVNSYLDNCKSITNLNETLKKIVRKLPTSMQETAQ